MVLAIFKLMFYNEIRTYERIYERVVRVNQSENKEYSEYMTNEQYREKIIDIFNEMDDNQKLRFWYKYISGVEKGRN